ncbi:MAG: nuclear transport factor 2 family protein [Puia sp.]|nr:nuclear transport factor 2 family protein [Puia sp.]
MPTQEAVMTTQDIANRLSELFRESKWSEAQEELFSEDALSIEPAHAQGFQSVKGLDKIREKTEQFNAMVEKIHGGFVTGPTVAGNHIAFGIGLDATFKGMGRQKMDEIAVYEVKDGKVVKEQFFY